MTPEQQTKLRELQQRQQICQMAFELLKAMQQANPELRPSEPLFNRCFEMAERFTERCGSYMEKGR